MTEIKDMLRGSCLRWVFMDDEIEFAVIECDGETDVWFRTEDICHVFCCPDFMKDVRELSLPFDYWEINGTIHKKDFVCQDLLFNLMESSPNENVREFPDWFRKEMSKTRAALSCLDSCQEHGD